MKSCLLLAIDQMCRLTLQNLDSRHCAQESIHRRQNDASAALSDLPEHSDSRMLCRHDLPKNPPAHTLCARRLYSASNAEPDCASGWLIAS